MYEKILIPLDGSELAEVALPYAEELAGRLGSEVTLLVVTESAESQDYHNHQLYIQHLVEPTMRLAERYSKKSGDKAIKVESTILTGHPAEEIVTYAEKDGSSLIIMATHGRSGIRRWSMGSVADKVVRAATQPVALIRAKGARPDVRERGILNRALVPLDGSKESEAVIPYIEELASKLEAEIVLVQVLERPSHVYAGGEGGNLTPYTDAEMEPLKAQAASYLEKMISLLNGKGIPTRSEVRVGSPAQEITNLADETDSDMVAMSTHGKSGFSRWAFGSVADKVLHAGNTPLLLVRTPGAGTE